MSFWIASPSMDPEVFFLSVATIGWELAVWRLVGTLILSLSAGFITHFVMQRDWLGQHILRHQQPTTAQSSWTLLKKGWQDLSQYLTQFWRSVARKMTPPLATEAACCLYFR